MRHVVPMNVLGTKCVTNMGWVNRVRTQGVGPKALINMREVHH
jgi:hypothetical protein